MKVSAAIAVFVIGIVRFSECLENGLALTPPMGWMHWERYRCITDCAKYPDECISENLFKRTADLLVAEGYAEAGYDYVIIDDCWLERERDNLTQKLVEDRYRFPNGLKSLADYIHNKGLKFGLYQDYGTKTCAGYPGVINHMELDVQTFVEWDVDYVKLDGCYADTNDMDKGYPEFGRLLNKTGRPMVYSCSWPYYQEHEGNLPNYEALKEHCNLWRNFDDIDDSYESVTSIIDYFSKNQDRIQPHSGPGHWNDPDMLILGNYGLSYEQSKTQMAVWAILAAPLIMSNDLRAVQPEIKDILLNRDIITVNQDPLGIQGRQVLFSHKIQVWARPVTPMNDVGEYSYAIAFVSRRVDGAPYAIKVTLKEIGMSNLKGYDVTDLFHGMTKMGTFKSLDEYETRINPTGVTFFKFTAI